jgi:hypothetical protein
MLKRKTESLEDLINQGLIANQKIPLPKKSNENVTGSYLEYPEENIEYGSNINYPNPYNEGEFFTPDNVSLGQQNIKKNIPLGLGMEQPTSMPRSMPMSIPSIEEPQQEDSTNFLGSLVSQGAAMLGAGVRGGDVGQVGRMFDLNRQETFRQGQYQKQKAEQKQKIKEQENTAKQYVDPNSEISIQERAKAKELYGDAISDKFSYADLQNRFVREAIEKKYNAIQEQKSLEEQKGLQSRLDDPKSPETLKLKNSLKLLGINVPEGLSYNEIEKNKSRLEKLSEPKPIVGGGVRGGGVKQEKPEKERKLSQDERQLLNNSALAYKAIFDMEDAIKRGVSKTSIFGDNDYTYAANRFVEGIGRMQSGGAIGTEEAENFKKLIPGRFDKEETAKNKIKDMKAELEARLKSINFDPKEVLKSRTYTEDISSPNKVKFSEEQ